MRSKIASSSIEPKSMNEGDESVCGTARKRAYPDLTFPPDVKPPSLAPLKTSWTKNRLKPCPARSSGLQGELKSET